MVKVPKRQTSPRSHATTQDGSRKFEKERKKKGKRASEGEIEREKEREGGRKNSKRKRPLLAFESKHELPGSKCSFSFFLSIPLRYCSLPFLPPSFGTSSPSTSGSRKKKRKDIKYGTRVTIGYLEKKEELLLYSSTRAQEEKKDEMRKAERGNNIIILGAPCETRELQAPQDGILK